MNYGKIKEVEDRLKCEPATPYTWWVCVGWYGFRRLYRTRGGVKGWFYRLIPWIDDDPGHEIRGIVLGPIVVMVRRFKSA